MKKTFAVILAVMGMAACSNPTAPAPQVKSSGYILGSGNKVNTTPAPTLRFTGYNIVVN